MRSRYPRIVLSGAVALMLLVTSSPAVAGPTPLPTNSKAFGEGYAELAGDWLEWLTAIPGTSNPLFDPDGAFAALGQSGKVWFLVGTTGGSATRTVTLPAGAAVFFPIVNYFWVNTPEYGDPVWSPEQEAAVRTFLAGNIDTSQNLLLEIDGRPVPNVDRLRVGGAVGLCTLPDDNIFGVPFAPVPHECVADGYWALLPPLSNGKHTIRFAGEIPATAFALDVTYHITVRGR